MISAAGQPARPAAALQLDLRVAAGIQTWLADLVVEGRNAEATLLELDQK